MSNMYEQCKNYSYVDFCQIASTRVSQTGTCTHRTQSDLNVVRKNQYVIPNWFPFILICCFTVLLLCAMCFANLEKCILLKTSSFDIIIMEKDMLFWYKRARFCNACKLV